VCARALRKRGAAVIADGVRRWKGIYRRRAGCAATCYQLDQRSGRWPPPPQAIGSFFFGEQAIGSLLIEECSSLFSIVVFRNLFPLGAGKESDPASPQVQTPVGLPVLRGSTRHGRILSRSSSGVAASDSVAFRACPSLIFLVVPSCAGIQIRASCNLQDIPCVQVHGEASDQ